MSSGSGVDSFGGSARVRAPAHPFVHRGGGGGGTLTISIVRYGITLMES